MPVLPSSLSWKRYDNNTNDQQREGMEQVSSTIVEVHQLPDLSDRIQTNGETNSRTEADSAHLSEDTFSFLIVAPLISIPFCTGLIVLGIKTTMYSLILADMMTKGTPNNLLGIPAALELPVVVSQVLAVGITVITQDDLITALQLIHTGYKGVGTAFQNTNYLKWFCPLFLLSWVGAYGLLVTFLLIITSADVVDLILNFTAIEFISLLDNIVFSLSSNGFFGSVNRATAVLVVETDFYRAKRNAVPWLQILLLTVSFIGMLCGLAIVVFLQASGHFLPSSIIVQFDDEVIPSLSTYSGQFMLEVSGGIFDEGRVVYRNEIGDGTIGYCSGLEAWTFGYKRTSYCDNVLAISENPTTRDISLILGQTWYVRIGDSSERFLPMEGVFSSVSCFNDLDCGGSDQGQCLSFRCICAEGYFGLRCSYKAASTCERIKVDELTDPFTGLRRKVSHDYSILRDPEGKVVTAYFHPIYIDSSVDTDNSSSSVDIVIYSGLRWILSSVIPPKDGLHTFFPSSFHISNNTLGAIEAATEIVSFNTAADESSAPTSLAWYLPGSFNIAEIDPVIGIDTVFVCSKCGLLFPCAYGNTCGDMGECICGNGESGSLCQVIPIGDGKCNDYFNKREFDFDGGDCCEASCTSGSLHQCGIVADNGLDNIPKGFPFCLDPSYRCEDIQASCWSRKSNPVPLLIKNSTGAFVTLSANGRTLIVSEPELDTVRIFDQVDSDWVQRGQTLEGEGKSRFGTLVALATLPGTVYKRRTGRVPVTLAVAAVGNNISYVEVYKFEPHDTEWSREGAPIQSNEVIDSISIGGKGGKFSLAIGLKDSNRCYLYLQDTDLNWRIVFNASGSSGVSLSGNGEILGCASTDPDDPEGSGLFRVSSLEIPDPYDINEVNLRTLKDMLPVSNFVYQSRPILGVVDYAGEYGITGGQVFPGTLGYNGFILVGMQLDANADVAIPDRLAEVGFDIMETFPEDERPVFSMSPDTMYFAINSQRTSIELFHVYNPSFSGVSIPLLAKTSNLPAHTVKGFSNKFSISNGGITMAVIEDDAVSVLQRTSTCGGSSIRLAITLDEVPDAVSWSLDYFGNLTSKEIPTENIASCRFCYGDDPRYIRVVAVEDFCIPKEREGCVQLTFAVDNRQMGDGAGFTALQDGFPFSIYSGAYETKKTTSGGCTKVCPEMTNALDFLMEFDEGFPKELRSPLGSLLWSSELTPPPGMGSLLLYQGCIFPNETGIFELVGSGGTGNWTAFLGGEVKSRQTFDIGKSQFFELEFETSNAVFENIPARCKSENCGICNICPSGMEVDISLEVNIGGFNGISCLDLATIGRSGALNSEFCSILPQNISALCGCRQVNCLDNESTMKVEIEFDNNPEDISWSVTNLLQQPLWNIDFVNYKEKVNSMAATFISCVPKTGPLFFTIRDRKSDGLCCNLDSSFFLPSGNRGYSVYLDNVLVGARNFSMGSKQDLVFRNGVKSSRDKVFQTSVWCEKCKQCKLCPFDNEFNPEESIYFELYGIQNCGFYAANTSNFITPEFCSEIQDHVSASCRCQNYLPECSSNESQLVFKTTVENAPGIITLKIRNQYNSTLRTKSGFVGDVGQVSDYKMCIPSNERIYVGLYDYCRENKLCSATNRSQFFEIRVDEALVARQMFNRSVYEFSLF